MSDKGFTSFEPSLVQFLDDLAKNNNREWFGEHKGRYESAVVEPVLNFIRAMKPRLMEISPYLMVEASKVGGSLQRVSGILSLPRWPGSGRQSIKTPSAGWMDATKEIFATCTTSPVTV